MELRYFSRKLGKQRTGTSGASAGSNSRNERYRGVFNFVVSHFYGKDSKYGNSIVVIKFKEIGSSFDIIVAFDYNVSE